MKKRRQFTMINIILFIVMSFSTTILAAETDASLEKAYEREFAFLAAQARILKSRLHDLDEKYQSDQVKAQKEINDLEDKMLAKRNKSERLNNLLLKTDRTLETRESDKEFFQNTIAQAENTLKKYNIDLLSNGEFEKLSNESKILSLFTQAKSVLSDLSRVTAKEGNFFLSDGSKATGEIIRIGNIAAYGISDADSGVLAPAGDGQFKLWPESTADVATAFKNKTELDTIQLFLFESVEKDISPQKEKTMIEVIHSGGAIAWIIVGLGSFAVLLCFARVIYLKSSSRSTSHLTQQVSELVKDNKLEEAAEFCKKKRGSIARVVAATIRNLHQSRDHLEDIISENILHESSTIDRFGTFILVIAAVAPLLGLLGTVTGMIATFDVITEFGTGDPKLLSGGISVALITTQIGLIVAIPILLIGNLLSGWSEKIKHDMEKSALRITNIYEDTRLANSENVKRIA